MNPTETLIQFIHEELLNHTLEVDADDNLLADDMIDSIGMLRLVMFIEETWGIKIPHGDLVIENFRTVAVIAAYLERRGISKNGHPAG